MILEGLYGVIITILLAAVITVIVFRALRMSSIVGYLIAGLIIGPHLSKIVDDIEAIKNIGEFGVLFLLFTIGLKMPIRRFRLLKKYVFGLGTLQVSITMGIITLIAICCSYSTTSAIFIASALSLSSTAVGLQLLTEQGELAQQYGRVSFSILLLQDLAVVLLLVLLSTIDNNSSLLESLGIALCNAAFVLFIITFCSKLILKPIFRLIAPLNSPEIFTAFSILIVLLTSLATDCVGLSKELGAFVAGFLLSGTEYRHQVEADIQPFYGLLLGLFFMAIGMTVDVKLIAQYACEIALLLTAMLLIKSLIIFFLCRLFGLAISSSFKAALLLSAGGEFAFVILKPSIEHNLISNEAAQIIYLAVAISMAISPLLLMISKWINKRFDLQEKDAKYTSEKAEIDDLKNHVIVAGFGRVGKVVCRLLAERVIPFVAIDNDMNKVLEGRAKGLPVFFGDATRDVVWKSLGGEKSSTAIISLSSPKQTLKAGLMVRRKFKNIDVSARISHKDYEEKLVKAGADILKPQIIEPSIGLASAILKNYGTAEEEATQIVDRFRRLYTGEGVKEETPS